MKKLLLLTLILTSLSIHSQKEANFWYFGHNAGLDFSTGTPISTTNGAFQTAEGSASISNKDGVLLFYTDGSTVYNRNHIAMPKGSGLLGNSSSAQSAIIVPKPLNSNIYYIFTVPNQFTNDPDAWGPGVNFSEVDITLNGNLGDITTKNTLLTDTENAFEKITSVKGEECNTFWVITSIKDKFYSFKIDKDGVTVNGIESVHFNNPDDRRGYLKISPDGKTLVDVNANQGTRIYDFNSLTGKITNERRLDIEKAYGVGFSRNSKKLYVSTGRHSQGNSPGFANIYQYSLDSNVITVINNSRKEIYSTNSGYRGALQLGPDGRIYYARSWQTSLGVINFPEKEANEVNFVENGLSLNGKLSREGLPPFIQSIFLPIEIKDIDSNQVLNNQKLQYCIGQTKTIAPDTVIGTGVTYTWEFEDTSGTKTTIHNDRVLTLTNLSKSNAGDYKLTVNLTDNCGNVTKLEGAFKVGVFEAATATKPKDILYCNTDNDGFNSFNLITTTKEILNTQSDAIFEVIYFLNEDDAKNNVTANALTLPYTNPTSYSKQTVYARVHNKNATKACYKITSFTLAVTQLPIPQNPTDYILCDDTTSAGGNTDGITDSFKLVDRDRQILGNLTDYSVSYHTTKVGAQTSNTTDVIDKNSNRSVTNIETVYVRVENNNNTACFDASKELKLIVASIPVIINNVATIKQCISTGNVSTTLNLSTAESNISTNSGGTFEYYEDQAGTTQINNYNAYPVVVNVIKSVWVKTISIYGCSGLLTELKIEIAPTPNQGYNKVFDPVCDDFLDAEGNDTFGSNSDTDFITNFPKAYFDEATKGIGAPANTTIYFYENKTDRINSVNAIKIANYRNNITKIDKTNTSGGIQFPIYYKIISTINNSCQSLGQFYLQIAKTPIVKTPSNFTLCDDFNSGQFDDGVNAGINLRAKIKELFAGTSQTETDYTVTFYKSAANANAGTNFIPLVETSNYKNDAPTGFVVGQVSKQTIYVRVQNKTTGCFNDHTSFDIIINPLPTISNAIPNIEVCDTPAVGDPDPRNGLARNIDLSIRDLDVLKGRSANDFKVSYHRTRTQATSGLVSTELNKTSYDNNPTYTTVTNGIGEETLYISIENKTTGCRYGISTLKIIVYPEPNLPAVIDNYSDCDHDNNGLGNDTDGIIENVSLINKKEQILANYATSEHSKFKVTFHTSKALAESGADPIDENKYKNTINNQTIYVRVQDTRTMCVNDDLTFQIIINPLPTFDQIDTPQIVCLNNLPLKVEVQNPLTDYTYSWKDKNGAEISTGIFANITKGGNYTISATMKDGTGCTRVRKFTIKESNIATITEADISIVDDSSNNSISINTINLGIGDYEFALFDKITDSFIVDYQNQPFFDNLKGGIYSIYVRDKNGCDINNIPVQLEVPIVEYPKFFTPNGDGKNDLWSIKGVNAFFFPRSTIYIFNRYGKVVGNISVKNNSWNGIYKGKPLPSDDYWFNIQLINKNGTARKPRKGHFSLIRK